MQHLTCPHEKINTLIDDLVNHGWGQLRVDVTSLKDATVRVDVFCGRQYVFFIKRDIKKFDENII